MPFTAAHPAAVLPLRKHLVLSALVIGSIAPDLHYFAELAPEDKVSHTVAGAFYLCLPLSLAVFCLFHWLLKLPLISLAPEWHQARLARFAGPVRLGPARKFGLVLISFLIGIFSHLLWDSFTHGQGWMVRHIVLLRSAPLLQMGINRPACSLLQYISTLLGVAILALAYVRWARTAKPQRIPENLKLSTQIKAGVITAIVSSASVFAVWYALNRPRHTHLAAFATYAAISFATLAFIGLLAFSVYWHRGMRSTASG